MIRRRQFSGAAIFGLGLSAFACRAAPARAPAAQPGLPAPPFRVLDTADRERALEEFAGRTIVLEWTSPTCPFAAAQYESGRMPELQKWATRKGVVWLSVLSSHPSRSDYLAAGEAERFNRTRGAVPTALLIDASGVMGRRYGALTANHMFVIDRRGTIVYAGGIDDAQSTKASEVRVARNFVRAALEDVLARRPVRKPEAEPAGCAISYEGT
jgi:peroxiredoxin